MKLPGWKENMMRRTYKNKVTNSNFIKEPDFITLEGKTVSEGDIIKIHGEHGKKFRFSKFVTRVDNGNTWIDCYEMDKGMPCGLRSFRSERIRTIPKRTPRKRNKIN